MVIWHAFFLTWQKMTSKTSSDLVNNFMKEVQSSQAQLESKKASLCHLFV